MVGPSKHIYIAMRIDTHMRAQCSHASVGLAQARPNESVRIDSKTVVFIRANPGKKETTDGSGSNVNFFGNSALFRKW